MLLASGCGRVGYDASHDAGMDARGEDSQVEGDAAEDGASADAADATDVADALDGGDAGDAGGAEDALDAGDAFDAGAPPVVDYPTTTRTALERAIGRVEDLVTDPVNVASEDLLECSFDGSAYSDCPLTGDRIRLDGFATGGDLCVRTRASDGGRSAPHCETLPAFEVITCDAWVMRGSEPDFDGLEALAAANEVICFESLSSVQNASASTQDVIELSGGKHVFYVAPGGLATIVNGRDFIDGESDEAAVLRLFGAGDSRIVGLGLVANGQNGIALSIVGSNAVRIEAVSVDARATGTFGLFVNTSSDVEVSHSLFSALDQALYGALVANAPRFHISASRVIATGPAPALQIGTSPSAIIEACEISSEGPGTSALSVLDGVGTLVEANTLSIGRAGNAALLAGGTVTLLANDISGRESWVGVNATLTDGFVRSNVFHVAATMGSATGVAQSGDALSVSGNVFELEGPFATGIDVASGVTTVDANRFALLSRASPTDTIVAVIRHPAGTIPRATASTVCEAPSLTWPGAVVTDDDASDPPWWSDALQAQVHGACPP